MPNLNDLTRGVADFFSTFLLWFWIPMLIILVFLTIVRFLKSNLAGIGGVAVAGIVIYLMIVGSSYREASSKSPLLLLPVAIIYIFAGLYHQNYRQDYYDTDHVMEKVKKDIQKEIAEKKIEVYERRAPEGIVKNAPEKGKPAADEDDF